MNIFYNVREIDQLNNLDFCNNSTLMYSYPFAFSLTILPNVPANLKSEQDIVKFLDNSLIMPYTQYAKTQPTLSLKSWLLLDQAAVMMATPKPKKPRVQDCQ